MKQFQIMWLQFLFMACFTQGVIGYQISQIPTPKIGVAIFPIWVDETQNIYFVNILSQDEENSIFHYNYMDGTFYSANIPGLHGPGFIMPVTSRRNTFAVGISHDVLLIEWDGKSSSATVGRTLFEVETNDPESLMDFGRAARNGMFYGGTYSSQICSGPANKSVYRYGTENGVVRLFGDVMTTAGIVFNDGAQKMYHVDHCSLLISEFDWDPATGDICNGRIAFNFNTIGKSIESFSPIGLEIDLRGMLYTTNYYGSSVWIINPRTSSVVDVIDIGIRGVAGVALGGPNRDVLYVTVSGNIIDLLNGTVIEQIPNGSSLYAITGLGVTNLPSTSLNV